MKRLHPQQLQFEAIRYASRMHTFASALTLLRRPLVHGGPAGPRPQHAHAALARRHQPAVRRAARPEAGCRSIQPWQLDLARRAALAGRQAERERAARGALKREQQQRVLAGGRRVGGDREQGDATLEGVDRQQSMLFVAICIGNPARLHSNDALRRHPSRLYHSPAALGRPG